MEFNAWLVAQGFDPETLSDSMKKPLQAQWRAEQNPAAKPKVDPEPKAEESPFNAKMQAIEAEADRVEYIRNRGLQAMQAEVGNTQNIATLREMVNAAVADPKCDKRSWDLALARFRPNGPMVFAPSAPQMTDDVVEAAVCRAAGLKDVDKQFSARTLETVDKVARRGMGLLEMIGAGARANGWRGDSVKRDLREAMAFAFHRPRSDAGGYGPMAVGPSTISVSGILSNVANKFIREAWMYVEQTWRRITAIRSVSDFKTITSYSMTGDNQYVKLAPGGQIEHGTLGNETYTNRADTYARILGIDRRDLINDDLGAFASVAKRLGRGGALKLNDVFWTEFMANASTFWTSARGNFDDGADSAFDAAGAGLKAADIIWRAKTDPDGKPLGAMARILLVPPTHAVPANQLSNSPLLVGGSTAIGQQNPWAGKFEPVVSDYLANSAYTGYSVLAWYLLADPNDIATIETCFLDGREEPTVETVEMDADRLGIAMRGYHDFGVAKQEYRGSLKMKGEA